MLAVSATLNWALSVDYFYNPIFLVFFTLGLSELIHSRLLRNLDSPK